MEYIISDYLFNGFPTEEQKLWHSHAYEIKSGLWITPRIPEAVEKTELQNLATTYGKFWCTWQSDRGDRLPLGPPALMMSPQAMNAGMVHPSLLKSRDDKYGIASEEIKEERREIEEVVVGENADYWVKHGKGFRVEVVETEMKAHATFP